MNKTVFWRFAIFYVIFIGAISFLGFTSPRVSIHNPADLTVLLGTIILSSFALFMEYRKMKKNQAKENEPRDIINKRLTGFKKSQSAFLFLILAHIISNSRQFSGAINNSQLEFSFLMIAVDKSTFIILYLTELIGMGLIVYLFAKNETE